MTYEDIEIEETNGSGADTTEEDLVSREAFSELTKRVSNLERNLGLCSFFMSDVLNDIVTTKFCLSVSIKKASYLLGNKYDTNLYNHLIFFKNERQLLEELSRITKTGKNLQLEITLPKTQALSELPNYVGAILLAFAHRSGERLPDIIGDVILSCNQARIVKMKTPEGLLNSSQQAQMDRIININKARMLAWSRVFLFSSISMVTVACAAASLAPPVLFLGFLMGFFPAKLREMFLDFTAKRYITPETIAEVTNDEEKQALLNGLEAKTWTGYFSSWGSLTNYKHLRAFCAAEKYACEGNKDIVGAIEKFRPAA